MLLMLCIPNFSTLDLAPCQNSDIFTVLFPGKKKEAVFEKTASAFTSYTLRIKPQPEPLQLPQPELLPVLQQLPELPLLLRPSVPD